MKGNSPVQSYSIYTIAFLKIKKKSGLTKTFNKVPKQHRQLQDRKMTILTQNKILFK